MKDENITCSWVTEHLEAFLDCDLTSKEAEGLERHLSSCPGCRAERNLAIRIQTALRALPEEICPDRVINAARDVIEKKKPSIEPLRICKVRLFPRALALAAVAAIVIAGTISFFAWRQRQIPEEKVSTQQMILARRQVELTLAYIGEVGLKSASAVSEDVVESKVQPSLKKAVHKVLDIRMNPFKNNKT